MKKIYCLILSALCSTIIWAQGFVNSNVYTPLLNYIGSNLYVTGLYEVELYNEKIADLYINNIQNQIAMIQIVSSHEYSKLALWELMKPYVYKKGSYTGEGKVIITIREGLLIADMEWGAFIISNPLLRSTEEFRANYYIQYFNQLVLFLSKQKNIDEIISKIDFLFSEYKKMENYDLLLVEKYESILHGEEKNVFNE